MGTQAFLDEFQRELRAAGQDFPYAVVLEAADSDRHVALLSKLPFKEVRRHAALPVQYLRRPGRGEARRARSGLRHERRRCVRVCRPLEKLVTPSGPTIPSPPGNARPRPRRSATWCCRGIQIRRKAGSSFVAIGTIRAAAGPSGRCRSAVTWRSAKSCPPPIPAARPGRISGDAKTPTAGSITSWCHPR